jgi:RNA polymerase sigma-70 factor (ECF subfamily)
VLTIVRNRALDAARRDAGTRDRDIADTVLERFPAPGDVAADALDRVQARELRALLDGLPDIQRDVIVLAFYGQLSHTEIAATLHLPLGTVKARLRRGLCALRVELDGEAA